LLSWGVVLWEARETNEGTCKALDMETKETWTRRASRMAEGAASWGMARGGFPAHASHVMESAGDGGKEAWGKRTGFWRALGASTGREVGRNKPDSSPRKGRSVIGPRSAPSQALDGLHVHMPQPPPGKPRSLMARA
jgi:hypothetical protein